jgi:hypothetical protein
MLELRGEYQNMKKYFWFFLILGFLGCTSIEQSAEKAFSNAGSAIRTGDPKIWEASTKKEEPPKAELPNPDEW